MSFVPAFLIILAVTAVLTLAGFRLLDRWPRAAAVGLITVLVSFSVGVNWLIIRDVKRATLEACQSPSAQP